MEMENEEDPESSQMQIDRNAERAQRREEELRQDERARQFAEMNEEDKDQLSCDQILALYLRELCKQVNENYYRTVVRFVLLYRECLNEFGWLKRRD